MNITKAIKRNKVFIIFQIIAFVAEVLLSVICDIDIYFPYAWVISLITIIYCGLFGTLITHKFIYKKTEYSKMIDRLTYLYTVIKIFKLSKKINDFETRTFLKRYFLSVGILILNMAYVFVITLLLHPESIS